MSGPKPVAGAAGRATPGDRRSPAGRGRLAAYLTRSATAGDWLSRLLGAAALAVAGVALGLQFVTPNKRVIAILAVAVLGGLIWRLGMLSGIGVLIVALPYPRGTVFGSTNVALVLAIVLTWLLRASFRHAPMPQRTPVDWPLLALLGSFIISFYNIRDMVNLGRGIDGFLHLICGMATFYLIVSNVRRPEHLERLHLFQCASVAVVGLFGIYEITHPNGVLIPGWIEFRHNISDAINVHNVRIGGPFFDFELLSEYCAVNALLVGLMLARARSPVRRAVFAALLLLTIFMMFATVTRGGIVSLFVGVVYLAWLQRGRIRIVPAVLVLATAAVGLPALNYFVANFTYSGDLFARLFEPGSIELRNGLPVARLELWQAAFERMMRHPIIGHGPVYDVAKGLDFWYWPHNGYLYIGNLVGITGLSFFLWLLWRLWRLSRPPGDDLADPDYARAFLIVARVQLLVFLVDQMKIDFMRISTYAYQVWLMFASIVAAHQVARRGPDVAAPARR